MPRISPYTVRFTNAGLRNVPMAFPPETELSTVRAVAQHAADSTGFPAQVFEQGRLLESVPPADSGTEG